MGPNGRQEEGLAGDEVMGVLRVLDKKDGVGGERKARKVNVLKLDRGMSLPASLKVEATLIALASDSSKVLQDSSVPCGDAAQPASTLLSELELYPGMFTYV